MADTETAAERDKRWEKAKNEMFDLIDSMPGLSDRQKAARRAEYEAEHNGLRANADKYEADRLGYLGSTPPTP